VTTNAAFVSADCGPPHGYQGLAKEMVHMEDQVDTQGPKSRAPKPHPLEQTYHPIEQTMVSMIEMTGNPQIF
jgi:hypothetical protein